MGITRRSQIVVSLVGRYSMKIQDGTLTDIGWSLLAEKINKRVLFYQETPHVLLILPRSLFNKWARKGESEGQRRKDAICLLLSFSHGP